MLLRKLGFMLLFFASFSCWLSAGTDPEVTTTTKTSTTGAAAAPGSYLAEICSLIPSASTRAYLTCTGDVPRQIPITFAPQPPSDSKPDQACKDLLPGLSSITRATQSGNTVTITTASPHGLNVDDAVIVSAVGVAEYNTGPVPAIVTAVPDALTFSYARRVPVLPESGGGTAQKAAAQGATRIAPSPAGATETNNIATIKTTSPHGLHAGDPVVVSGVGVAGYNTGATPALVREVVDPITFTYPRRAARLAPSGGGTAQKPAAPDASLVVGLLGSPKPYTVTAQGKDRILIYSSKATGDRVALRRLIDRIRQVVSEVPLASAPQPFAIELAIPHSAALGDLATKLQTLGYSQLQIVDVGPNRVRITDKAAAPDCKTWKPFLQDVRRLVWQIHPESPVEKLYYLSASDVNTAFGGGAPSAAAPSPAPGGSGGPAGAGTPPAAAAPSSTSPASPTSGSAAPAAGAGGVGASTVTVTQPGLTTTVTTSPSTPASAPAGANASPPAPAGGTPPSAPSTASATPSPGPGSTPAASSSPKPGSSVAPLSSDLLVFSDPIPGDDAVITEKKRILAALDLPRPEMLINAWVMQNSTQDRNTFGSVSRLVREAVHEHNDGLDLAMLNGWTYLKKQVENPSAYFNLPFYSYLTERVIFDAGFMAGPGYNELSSTTQRFLNSQESSSRGSDLVFLSIAPDGARETGNTATITTTSPHWLNIDDRVVVSGVGIAGYNTGALPAVVTEVPSPTTFRYTTPTVGLPTSGGGAVYPTLKYAIAPDGASETANIATITTTSKHLLNVGDQVIVSGVGIPGYNTGASPAVVTAVPSPTTFSYTTATAGLAASGGGMVYPLRPSGLRYAGSCNFDKYCLGYTTLFQPLQPRLTNLLLALIAAADPGSQLKCAINYIEGQIVPDAGCNYLPVQEKIVCDNVRRQPELDKIAKQLQFCRKPSVSKDYKACDEQDQMGILNAMSTEEASVQRAPRLFLECFRQTTSQLLSPADSISQPSTLGLIRAAVADFLFNYKIAIQYPHEFVPYDLTQSADRFNSALEPMIAAFNRDLTAYQGVLRARIGVEIDELNRKVTPARWFNLDKPTFLNDGIVTVNTLSGTEATVNTTTQSYIDVSTAPSVSALLSAVAGEGASSGNVGTSNLTKPSPGVLSNLTFNQAQVLAGALSAYQSSKAQIGRQLNVDVTPRSLVGASTAELQVTLKADDSASPPIYSSGPLKGSDPEVSRFATNEITTRVRVDSLKLFEVSSFTAVLRNSRRRLPLLPPFVELPYIGTLAGVPLPAAQQYQSSTAVLSAVVVPTATDLAQGIRFMADRIVEENEGCVWPPPHTSTAQTEAQDFRHLRPCRLRHAESLSDFAGQPVREFNRMMILCLATDMHSANPNMNGSGEQATCTNLTYGKVFHESE